MRRPVAAEFDPDAYYDPFAEARREILPSWAEALDGIEDHSHLLVIFWSDRALLREECADACFRRTRETARSRPVSC